MNKLIKYGVVAGLTMAAFSLATTPATYAEGECTIADAVAGSYVYNATGCANVKVGVYVNATAPAVKTIDIDATGSAEIDLTSYVNSVANGNYHIEFCDEAYDTVIKSVDAKLESKVIATANPYVYTAVRAKTATAWVQDKASNPWNGAAFNGTLDEAGNGTIDLTEYFEAKPAGTYKLNFTDLADTVSYSDNFTVVITGKVAATEDPYVFDASHATGAVAWVFDDESQTWKEAKYDGSALDVAGTGTIDMTEYFSVKNAGTYKLSFSDAADVATYSEVLTVVVEPTVAAEVEDKEILATTNIKDAEITYAVKEGNEKYVEVSADGKITEKNVVLAADKTVTIIVKAEKDDLSATEEVTYTIEANYTAVEASFEDDKDTIKVSGDTTIVIEKVDGVDYEYVYDDDVRLTIDKDGKVTVNEDTLLGEDTEFTITIKAIVDGVEIAEKDLTLTVEKNYTASFKEPLFEIIDGAKIEAGKPVVVEIDAKMDGLWNIVVFNKALFEKYLSGEDMTEEELESMAYQLAEDDCTVTEGSTIITLSDAFLAKLPAGDYLLRAYFYDNSDVDDIKEGYAESVFSVAAAPDTGAYTASTSATSSVLASVLAAVTAAGAVVVAKFAKRK